MAPVVNDPPSSERARGPEIATQRDAESVEQGVDLVPLLVAGVGAGEDSHTSDVGGRSATPCDPRGVVVISAGSVPVSAGITRSPQVLARHRRAPEPGGVDQAHVGPLLLSRRTCREAPGTGAPNDSHPR
jgi:hypothetical protein